MLVSVSPCHLSRPLDVWDRYLRIRAVSVNSLCVSCTGDSLRDVPIIDTVVSGLEDIALKSPVDLSLAAIRDHG
jgi:hypothetical protein